LGKGHAKQSEAGLSIGAGAQKLIRADRSHAEKNKREGAGKFSDQFLGLRVHENFS
jgi:hypothetical protein